MISYIWKLSDLENIEPNHLKVFSCFSGGGGSSMGYKLAGFNIVGCCEIDPKMLKVYQTNLNPKYHYLGKIQDFNKQEIFPDVLMDLDILDGSPPCSSFSMVGNRESDWGKNKHFAEGQAKQVLDDLFFEFIALGKKLRPKVIIAENVKGLILGNAKGYVKLIFQAFSETDYDVQLFLLNAATMGVPQARERVFFIARRKDLNLPKVNLSFNETPIPVSKALSGCLTNGTPLAKISAIEWQKLKIGKKAKSFSLTIANPNRPCGTLTSCTTTSGGSICHWESPRKFSVSEAIRIQSFPSDYNFLDANPGFVLGMSVPPIMMHRIANSIKTQLFR